MKSFLKNKNMQLYAGIIFGVLTVVILVVVFSGEKKTAQTAPSPSAQNEPEGFTFFDIGIQSKLTDDVRESLSDKLGSDAIERSIPLDLNVNYPGFLKDHFKELDELNRRLNFPIGERIEHNIIKLEYRHTQKKKVPFEFVELIFSGYTQNPLVFRILSNKEGALIVDTIKKKYGEFKVIEWDQGKGRSLYWERDKSILIISIGQDRYGDPEYYTVIYYTPNIQKLWLKEKQEAKNREEEIKKKGKTAF